MERLGARDTPWVMFAERRRFDVLMVSPVHTGRRRRATASAFIDRPEWDYCLAGKLDKVYSGNPGAARFAHNPEGEFRAGAGTRRRTEGR